MAQVDTVGNGSLQSFHQVRNVLWGGAGALWRRTGSEVSGNRDEFGDGGRGTGNGVSIKFRKKE